MATAPRPRILPKITYSPPSDPPDNQDPRAQAGDALNNAAAGIYDWLNRTGDTLMGGTGKVGYVDPSLSKVARPTDYDWSATNRGGWADADASMPGQPPQAPQAPTNTAGTDARGMQGGPQGGQNYGQAPTNTAGTVPQSALTNNRANMAAAQAAGDTANIARLDAEWKRIAPLAQSRGITAERLVNSYMQPGNPAAKSDLNSALAAAISDDVWGAEATQAFGRPPNQLEWDEHFRAMNMGGRDPLEGHPQAVQNIQAAMQNMGQQNQTGQYDAYSQWLAGQK